MMHFVARFVPVLAVVVVSAPQVAAQTPPARFSHGVVFDVARGETVVFGGDAGNQSYLTDTWRRTTNGWSQGPAGHPAVETIAGCYDRQRNVIVGVGGGGNAVQTWEYNGTTWTQRSGPAPAGRILHTMAFDEARNESVLFAGFNGFNNFADTWTWNGITWSQRQPATSPPARRHHSMAYDRLRQRVVLFGGYTNSNTILGDTWEWDGVTWTQRNPTTSPPARYLHGLAWDGARSKVIAFGGTSQPFPASATLDDTWQYDGTTWSPVASPLRPLGRLRIDHAMTFDESRQSVVLFGGRMGDSGAQTGALNDTWELTASGWRPVLSFVPSPVNGRLYALTPPMTWPQAEALAVSYGGHLATVRNAAEHSWIWSTFGGLNSSPWIGLNDRAVEGQWVWSSGELESYRNWSPAEPNGGTNEDCAHMWFTLSGFWNDTNELGLFPGIIELPGGPTAPFTATPLTASAPPPPLAATALAPLPTGGAVLFGGQTSTGPQFGTYELQGTAWTKRFSLLNPMVRTAHALALDGARQDVLLFGGRNPLGVGLNDTWTWANGQWSYRQPATAPSPRSGHRLAYDPTAQTVELFGGVDAAGADLGDHWQWNGTTWTQRTPATLPPARRDHGLAFDARRQRLVLHGGASGAAVRDDVWEWNGTAWTQVTPQAPTGFPWAPTARAGHAFAYDPRAERLLLHGGADAAGACTADAWTWDGSAWTRLSPTGSAPSARRGSTAFFDPAANELRLFAGACGSGFANDLWRLDLPVFASSETYGQGCVGTLGMPTMAIEAPSRPLVGTTLNLRFVGVPGQFIPAIGAYGEQRDNYVGLPLPLDLGVVGLPGCMLWTSAEETFVLPAPNNTGSVLWAVAIPNDPLLLGTSSFFQGLCFELPGYPRWASMSNAVGVRIGNQ